MNGSRRLFWILTFCSPLSAATERLEYLFASFSNLSAIALTMPLFGPEASKASASAWSIGRKRGTKHAPLDVSKGYDVDWQAVGKELGDLFTSVSTMATQVGTSQPPPAKSKSAARAPWRKKKGAEAEATGDIVSTGVYSRGSSER